MTKQAFSLVELSIVLVILGLLTGGILAGQSLIRASELRAVTAEYQRYLTAAQTFRDKYFAIPGDMTNATAFWGYTGGAGCTNSSGTAVTIPGTCDGNGNGQADVPIVAGQSGDSFQGWRQLALAGLIEGSYTGIAGAGGVNDSTIGTNVPKSKIANGGWDMNWWDPQIGGSSIFDGVYGNIFQIGAPKATLSPSNPLFKPEELWNIDTKLDDGLPAQGKVFARNFLTCTTATASSQTSATYLLSSSSIGCVGIFRQQF